MTIHVSTTLLALSSLLLPYLIVGNFPFFLTVYVDYGKILDQTAARPNAILEPCVVVLLRIL